MKKKLLLICVLGLYVFSGGFAQTNQLYLEIQHAKKARKEFQEVPSVFNYIKEKYKATERFEKPEEVYFFDYSLSHMRNINIWDAHVRLIIPLPEEKLELELLEVPDSFYDYEIVTEDGTRYPANRNIRHYRGNIKDKPNSLVAISIDKEEISGVISEGNGNLNLALDRSSGKHILYNENNLKVKERIICEVENDQDVEYDPKLLLTPFEPVLMNVQSEKAPASFHYKYLRLFYETRFELFQREGSINQVERYVIRLFNQVATLFQNENILTGVSEIRVWTTPDPYTGGSSSTILTQFQNTRTSINGDLGQLLGIGSEGIAAGFEGICNSQTKNKLSVALLPDEIEEFPTYTRAVKVSTHEFGHLMGSRHTHACVWNGNNTAIDGCWDTEGSCTKPSMPYRGTIMSYCDQQGRPGVDFSLGFGPQPGNVIRAKVNNASCLQVGININGSSLVTTTGTTYTLSRGSASSWRGSPNLQLVSYNTTSATFRSIGKGAAWVEATLNMDVGNPRVRQEVWSGPPVITGVTGPSSVPNYQYATYRAVYDEKSLATGFQWILNPQNGNSVYGGGPSCDIAFYNEGSYQLLVRASNANGMGDYFSSGMRVYKASSYGYSFFPNPTSDILYVVLSEHVSPTQLSDGVLPVETIQYDIRLYDGQGKIVRRTSSKGGQIEWSVSNLPEGTYYLHIYDKKGSKPEKQQIIIRR